MDVILPVLDEAEALPGVLDAFPAGFRPLVVDNGSSDDSAAVARGRGARVISEPRRGFGAACWAGLQAAESELVCFMDADGSLDPRELATVCAPLISGGADLCLGARRPDPGAWPPHARLANRLIAWELSRRCGVRLRDLGPMRCARRAGLLELGLTDRAFGWPLEMVLSAAAQRWQIVEVTVAYHLRTGGQSKVSGSLSGSLRAARDMSRLLSGL
ncbi:glycosyltransferase family 2 protein [Conexibacter sp. DBS9H8]|uniref:glycosyltransferase family 2 protein n=1 Tax=Conexibacter sp. DBS9H8 TaxID=2937801 RepID=UPI0035307BD6